MKNKLLPCPFCGEEPQVWKYKEEYHRVLCRKCYLAATMVDAKEVVITAWNTRTDDKHLSQLRNLLAVIHRDGGHYTEKHGLEKSQHDAIKKVTDLIHSCGWISVEDQLPEKGQKILTLFENGLMSVDHVLTNENYWTNGIWRYEPSFVTHWMALPNPPDAGKGDKR